MKTRKYGLRQVKGGEGTAKRTISTFKSVLSFAVDRGFIVENVALGVRLAPDNKCERFLSEEEAGRAPGPVRAGTASVARDPYPLSSSSRIVTRPCAKAMY